jgi:hypothetical protein
MTVWIITTGSSDVQLKTKANWSTLFPKVRAEFFNKTFPPSENGRLWTVPARVIGTVYSQSDASGYFDDLVFPLLNNFVDKIQSEEISRIILILTNQVNVFSDQKKGSVLSPFWDDTCTLRLLLRTYLKAKYPKAKVTSLTLKPERSNDGLDDWDSVFRLVQSKFSKFCVPEDGTIYVSHQAGTPAISSAVQFASLARFGQRVKFLVSSAQDAKLTRVLESSAFLKGLKLQEAKALLKRYDYAGIKVLLVTTGSKKLDLLLDAAVFWNFAEFQKFADILKDSSDILKDSPDLDLFSKATELKESWCLSAYEAAYLALIRLKQGNTVDAMFHSFRAVEGLMNKYAKELAFDSSIPEVSLKGKQIIFECRCNIKKEYLSYGKKLYDFVSDYKVFSNSYTACDKVEFDKFGETVFKERNELFHNLIGLDSAQSVFEKWDTPNEEKWKNRVGCCLNFISGQTFSTLEEASIMHTVHKELVAVIASLAQTPD